MSRRNRRLLTAVVTVAGLLFAGRWSASFLAESWWAGAISPEAQAALTGWSLLGLALRVGTVLVSSTWFAVQAILVVRAIASVQVEERVGNLVIREAIPPKVLIWASVATGIVLGLASGPAIGEWQQPVALALEGVQYGVSDPLLGVDLGVLIAQYPVWQLLQSFSLVLVALGGILVALLYAGIGAIGWSDRRLVVHALARRQIGGLLAIFALIVGWGFLLGPYGLATAPELPLDPDSAAARILIFQAGAGVSLAASIISIWWVLRPRGSLLVAGWSVLALFLIAQRVVAPAVMDSPPSAGLSDSTTRAMNSIFWGLRVVEADDSRGANSTPLAIWDHSSLSDWEAARGRVPMNTAAVTLRGTGAWALASHPAGEEGGLDVVFLQPGGMTADGEPIVIGGDRLSVAEARVVPGRRSPVDVAAGGVGVGGPIRRAVLAWALQRPGLLRSGGGREIDWALDPAERLSRLIPALDWLDAGLADSDGRLHWIVSGMATVDRAPLSQRQQWRGREVSGLVPSLIGLVNAADGTVRIFTDPGADSLGTAWGRVFGSLVEPAESIPEFARVRLSYQREWLEAQLTVIEGPSWHLGQRPAGTAASVVWQGGAPQLQSILEDPVRGLAMNLVSAERIGGIPTLRINGSLPDGSGGARELSRAWGEMGDLARLGDSVTAAGDSMVAGPIRWRTEDGRLRAWQSWRSLGRQGRSRILWISYAEGGRLGGVRHATLISTYDSLRPPGGPRADFDLATRMAALRGWMARADSALARGDLTAFGRAFEALRGLLETTPRE